jgi:hypothetical protein
MKFVGNAKANKIWEANVPQGFTKPQPKDDRYASIQIFADITLSLVRRKKSGLGRNMLTGNLLLNPRRAPRKLPRYFRIQG